VAIFELVGAESEVDKKRQDEIKLWHQCLKHYRAQGWDQAEVALLNLQRMHPGYKLYEEFSERISEYRKDPPSPGWDGVTKFKTK